MNRDISRQTPLLLSVWQEACRHIVIRESTELIAAQLREYLPLATLLVRRIEIPRLCSETVGIGAREPEAALPLSRTVYQPKALEQLLAWCRLETAVHLPAGRSDELRALLLPEGAPADVDVLAAPLCTATGPVGLALFIADAREAFTPSHLELAQALRDPLAAALENDLRVREMEAHREAAEADRQSLLTRLGREQVSDAIVGAEVGLRPVMERVDLVARSDVPVLILGETGSGKEVIARAIHNRSGRAGGPFMRVNCGAIPPELIDSELFGHERGSFTGASGLRKGWFERADDGTLFLDEVAELPLAAQVRLLRILQDGTFERVGGQSSLTVNVRVVAATHRDLRQMVSDGRFREDLWYRIAVFPIDLPALRDRPEDLPALAAHFATKAARRFGLPLLMPTREDLSLLAAYDWPGNIRELGAVIDRAAILGDGRRLEMAAALGQAPRVRVAGPAAPRALPSGAELEDAAVLPSAITELPAAAPRTPVRGGDFATLDEAMRTHIEAALLRTHGRVEGPHGAARLLKINPHTLRARMRKLRIEWAQFRPAES
jgi:transcriptional regulator with GAF, ATPase, and Fis domain